MGETQRSVLGDVGPQLIKCDQTRAFAGLQSALSKMPNTDLCSWGDVLLKSMRFHDTAVKISPLIISLISPRGLAFILGDIMSTAVIRRLPNCARKGAIIGETILHSMTAYLFCNGWPEAEI